MSQPSINDPEAARSANAKSAKKQKPQTMNDVVILGYPRTPEEAHCFPYYDFIVSCSLRFDISFIFLLVIENVNFGLWVLVGLAAQDYYKSYLECEPSEMTFYSSMMGLPWSLKILYGLITDNVPICGLKRKPYLIFFGFLQFVLMLSIFVFDFESGMSVCILLTFASAAMAFSNVVTDAILIVQSRKDPELGSQDLMSLMWLTQSLAGIVGCTIAAIMMEKYHPKYAFLGYGCYGLFLGVATFFLSAEAEQEFIMGQEPEPSEWSSQLRDGQSPSEALREREEFEANRPKVGEEGFWYNFKRNMRQIGVALTRPEIYLVVIYFLVDGITTPSFSDYTYFFLMNTVGVSKFMFAMIALIGQVCALIGVVIYEKCLKSMEVRTVLIINVAVAIVGAFLAYAFAMRWNLSIGISDYFFLIFTDVVFGAFAMAFSTLPVMSLFAKITPKRIEGTIFAFLTGTSNLDQGVIQPLMGNFVNSFVGVSKDDLSGYPTLMLVALCCAPIGFATIFLIPTQEAIDESQKERAEIEAEQAKERQQRREDRQRQRQQNKPGQQEGGENDDQQSLINGGE